MYWLYMIWKETKIKPIFVFNSMYHTDAQQTVRNEQEKENDSRRTERTSYHTICVHAIHFNMYNIYAVRHTVLRRTAFL